MVAAQLVVVVTAGPCLLFFNFSLHPQNTGISTMCQVTIGINRGKPAVYQGVIYQKKVIHDRVKQLIVSVPTQHGYKGGTN